ncbi:ribonuclease III domain-containing protein [Aspergillus pseudodeflectus]|uniref:Ribonuclease III domain-containing protein n=1 Tax=Aspergillus pseudodeflectus TaxID=176178 RepID=A0ABR4K0E9_9EURO
MDRKRKSVFSSRFTDGNPVEKIKKHSHREHDTNRVPPFHFLIEQLTKIADKEDVKPSEDVLKAATDLSRALQRTPLPSKAPANLTGIDTTIPPKLPKDHASPSQSLPPLPRITDANLEKTVFTLPAMSSDPTKTYDRLEILGDAYIELIATKLIWNRFPEIPSGRISQIRESLVKNETLAEYSTKYGLDSRTSFPQDYLNQPKRLIKTKGDLFEAYVAAIIISHPNGYSIAEDWLSQLWISKLEALDESPSHMHAKQALAKRVLRRKGFRLDYIDEKPPVQHQGTETFFIGVYLKAPGLNNKHLGSGQGLSKAAAGNKAAQRALENEDLMNEITTMRPPHGTECG